MKWNSIRAKLIIFLLLATVIPIVTTMFVTYSYTAHSLRTRVAEEDTKLLYQGGRHIVNLVEDLNRSSSNVFSISNQLKAGYEDVQSDSRVYAVLSNIATSVPDIFQVYLYENGNRKATLVTLNTPQRNYNTDVYTDVLTEDRPTVWVQKSHMSHTYGLKALQPRYPSRPVFTLHRRIENVPSSEVIGYLSIDVSLTALTDIVDQLYNKEREKIFIVDENGDLIYADEQSKLGEPLQESWYSGVISASGRTSGHFEQDGSLFIYNKITGKGMKWTIVKQIPVSYLVREANHAAGINLLLLAVSLIVIAAATIIISVRITAPIKQLGKYMNQIQSGNLNVDIQPASNDEIGAVMLRFRSMMDTINNLILREYKLELANKTNQLRAMQAQINPHFLNNTLQIIGTLALELKMPRIYALLSALAKMMHYSMHFEDKNVTLRDELEHVKAYIELQKERFESRFQFQYDVDDSLLDLPMPKMILQPVVENYFKHGLDRTASDGELTLAARRLGEGQFEIVVRNNGAQIPEGRLQQLQQKLSDLSADRIHHPVDEGDEASRPSIGLANVLARLQLVNRDSAALTISNLDPVGVQITLIIPDQNRSGA
ncbi:sensor histidine kinase [Paenibacillus sp. FSL W8-0186]|uniref:Histidine kinase n=1 Tax=Paenibacillus woosongensis TaxID=307580 RepID=A0ABQ4MVT0_9BACL|nr:sensor histidine kinase [Paenibacillus woosongensis]GIP60027.1 histidine kinase [Paenibacillus woosongensis]